MTVFDIWAMLDDIRFMIGMIGLLVLFTFVAVVAHVVRHWNDDHEDDYEEDDDAGESTDDRT